MNHPKVRCYRCQFICDAGLPQCPECAAPFLQTPSASSPDHQVELLDSPPSYPNPSHVQQGDSTGGLIPYKNPKALIAYYLGILSGLPLVGLPLGIAALVLGILGLKDRNKNPVIKGSVHAGIGIGCGAIFSILWSLLAIGIIMSLLNK